MAMVRRAGGVQMCPGVSGLSCRTARLPGASMRREEVSRWLRVRRPRLVEGVCPTVSIIAHMFWKCNLLNSLDHESYTNGHLS